MTQLAWGSKRAALLALVAVVLSAGDAMCADRKVTQQARAQVLQTVLDCRKLTGPSERLACFDAAVATMGEAETKGDIVIVDREQVRAARRQAFGIALPSLDMFTRGEKPETVDRVEAVAKQAWQDARGRWVVILDDGARWEQIDDETPTKSPRAGSAILITKASLGSYFMKIDGGHALRAHRVN